MKIERKGKFGVSETVEYSVDILDDIEIEDKERKAICTNVYSIKNEQLFEKDKKVLAVIEFPGTTALFELKLVDQVIKDEDSEKVSDNDDEISFRRLGIHVYGYQFLDVY